MARNASFPSSKMLLLHCLRQARIQESWMFFPLGREGECLWSIKCECVHKPFVPQVLITKTHYAEYPIKSFSVLFFLQFFSLPIPLSLTISRDLEGSGFGNNHFCPQTITTPCGISHLCPLIYFHSDSYSARTRWPLAVWDLRVASHFQDNQSGDSRWERSVSSGQAAKCTLMSWKQKRPHPLLLPEKSLWGISVIVFSNSKFSFWLFKIVLISLLGFPSVHAIFIHPPLSLLI